MASVVRELRDRVAPLSAVQRRHWDENGFLVLPGFCDPDTVAAVNDAVDRAWADRHRPGNPLVLDVISGPN